MRYYLLLLIIALMLVLGACTGGKDLTQHPDAEVHYTMGLSYLREPNPAMALKSFLEAEKMAPDDPKIQDALAQAYMKKKAYSDKRADKRPVWVMGADGSNPHVIELLHYQCAIDGSRASWRPR